MKAIYEYCERNEYTPSEHEPRTWFSKTVGSQESGYKIKIRLFQDKVRASSMIKYVTLFGPNSTGVEIYVGTNADDCIKAITEYQSYVAMKEEQATGINIKN